MNVCMDVCMNEWICVQVSLGDYFPWVSAISAHFSIRGTSYLCFEPSFQGCLDSEQIWKRELASPPQSKGEAGLRSRTIKRTCPSRDKDQAGLVLIKEPGSPSAEFLPCVGVVRPSPCDHMGTAPGNGTDSDCHNTATLWATITLCLWPGSLLYSAGIHAMAPN